MTPSGGDRDVLETAVAALLAGDVVGIPTDTVYGLAVDPRHHGATDALFALKGRPVVSELPVLVADVEEGRSLAGPRGWPEEAGRLADRFWPGALTIVVERRAGLDWEIGGDGRTIGVRCPAHAIARTLCDGSGRWLSPAPTATESRR